MSECDITTIGLHIDDQRRLRLVVQSDACSPTHVPDPCHGARTRAVGRKSEPNLRAKSLTFPDPLGAS